MAVTDPGRQPYQRHVDVHRADRHARASRSSATSASAAAAESDGGHGYVRYNDVRVPATTICSASGGEAFVVAQTRLGGGRIHHAMRTVGLVRKRAST